MVAMECGCSERRPRRPPKSKRERKDGADVYRSQARKEVFRDNQRSGGDAKPHRGSEGIIRPIPAGEGAGGRSTRRGSSGRIQIGISDLRFFQFVSTRIREVRIRVTKI